MKKLLICLIFIICFSCDRHRKPAPIIIAPPHEPTVSTLTQKSVPIEKEIFTSTQKYEIMCWTVKNWEGYSAKSYRCSANKRTTGWGDTHIKSVKNIHHADRIFKRIILGLFEDVSKAYPKNTYLQKCAVVSLLYNCGNLEKIKNSGFSRHLLNNNIPKAIAKFKLWSTVHVDDKTIAVKGLVNRRMYESKLLDGSFDMNDYVSLKNDVTSIYIENRGK